MRVSSDSCNNALDHGWEAMPTTAASAAAGWYAHGADWAQAVDFTVVVTLRCDVTPLQLVAATRTHRRPWPVMIGILNTIGTRYPGSVAHDATGGGRSSPSTSRCTTSSTFR